MYSILVFDIVHDRRIPKLRDDYILVKTIAVGLNPTDWKHIDFIMKEPGPLVGCDYAGILEDVGSKITKPCKNGDGICGMGHGSNAFQRVPTRRRYFAEHIVVKGDIQIGIFDNINCEQAATLGIGIAAVGQGLYQGLSLTIPTDSVKTAEPMLIYGGSTATGQCLGNSVR
ncbi:zinc-binding oxidoreductase ToxD [Penicillium samsonianum]|uniref:zinc-binding oxidoreductase ToxD n=1 Tax=Penicillium samsonianum TaxID=1882272 RepID=UPI002548F046|nr:zinc-binding oxidoreductase ToxD [Penicillium samsonianum]KAJ6118288.1 zinc-binding oxidoreductase ToxD [Penicillium samsonianum]